MQERWSLLKDEINSIHKIKEIARKNAEARPIFVSIISLLLLLPPFSCHFVYCLIFHISTDGLNKYNTCNSIENLTTIMILSFWTDRSGQIWVYTAILSASFGCITLW